MNRWYYLAVIAIALTGAGTAAAQRPLKGGPENCCPAPRCCCPDDYCRKSSPRIYCPPCGECACYDRKPCPRVCSLCGGCPDDYCGKPCPRLCPPACHDYYRCVPVDGPCCAAPPTTVETRTCKKEKVGALLRMVR